jgi:hypothetical protein
MEIPLNELRKIFEAGARPCECAKRLGLRRLDAALV